MFLIPPLKQKLFTETGLTADSFRALSRIFPEGGGGGASRFGHWESPTGSGDRIFPFI